MRKTFEKLKRTGMEWGNRRHRTIKREKGVDEWKVLVDVCKNVYEKYTNKHVNQINIITYIEMCHLPSHGKIIKNVLQ